MYARDRKRTANPLIEHVGGNIPYLIFIAKEPWEVTFSRWAKIHAFPLTIIDILVPVFGETSNYFMRLVRYIVGKLCHFPYLPHSLWCIPGVCGTLSVIKWNLRAVISLKEGF
jgi:hypothetical protein